MTTSVNTRIVALSLALAALVLSGCDRRSTDTSTPSATPSTTTTPAPAPMAPASPASR